MCTISRAKLYKKNLGRGTASPHTPPPRGLRPLAILPPLSGNSGSATGCQHSDVSTKLRNNCYYPAMANITGCGVAQHCYNGDVSFLWANGNFDPCKIETRE